MTPINDIRDSCPCPLSFMDNGRHETIAKVQFKRSPASKIKIMIKTEIKNIPNLDLDHDLNLACRRRSC